MILNGWHGPAARTRTGCLLPRAAGVNSAAFLRVGNNESRMIMLTDSFTWQPKTCIAYIVTPRSRFMDAVRALGTERANTPFAVYKVLRHLADGTFEVTVTQSQLEQIVRRAWQHNPVGD